MTIDEAKQLITNIGSSEDSVEIRNMLTLLETELIDREKREQKLTSDLSEANEKATRYAQLNSDMWSRSRATIEEEEMTTEDTNEEPPKKLLYNNLKWD